MTIINNLNYNRIDLLKGVSVIFVLLIHISDFQQGASSYIVWNVSRLGVPLFFIASAFICWRNLKSRDLN